MIDNFNLIKPLLEFPSDDIYYHLQIIQRKKDLPEMGSNNRMLKAYFICNLETLDSIEKEVKDLCNLFKARAYINLTPKSIRKTTLLQIQDLAKRVYDGEYKKIWKSWNSCAGTIKGENPRWVIDVDNVTTSIFDKKTKEIISVLYNIEPVEKHDKVQAVIPTKSGWHIITTPFNLQKFKEIYPDIDVHKNNPTLLYCL